MNPNTPPPQDDDEMPAEIDFSKGMRSKFNQANATLHLPVYSDAEEHLGTASLENGNPVR